jgi:hypothetical protein
MVLIGYELNHVVHSQISPMDLWAFLPEQPVTNGDDICHDPDTMCMRAPYTYDALFTWNYEVVPGTVGWGDHDIRFRNADFKTP